MRRAALCSCNGKTVEAEAMRKIALYFAFGGLCVFGASCAFAQSSPIVSANDLVWKAAPGALRRGAEIAILFGDPGTTGPFTIRLRAPAGYQIAPHSHPDAEMLTVLSGALRFGQGQRLDPGLEKFVHAGDFIAIPPGMGHWLVVNEDAVLQVSGIGPMEIDYLDPSDEPGAATR